MLGLETGGGWCMCTVIYISIYMCVTKEMCKCTKRIHTFREHGHRLGRRPFRLRLFFLVVLGSHSCLAADGLRWIAVQSRRVSLEKKGRRCRDSTIQQEKMCSRINAGMIKSQSRMDTVRRLEIDQITRTNPVQLRSAAVYGALSTLPPQPLTPSPFPEIQAQAHRSEDASLTLSS